MSYGVSRYTGSTCNEKTFIPLTPEEKVIARQILQKEFRPILTAYVEQMMVLKNKDAEGDRMIIEGDRKIAEGDRKIAEGQRGQKIALVTIFYRIFYGNKKPVPAGQIDSLFSTYLADGSISFEKSKDCFKLGSMKGVISYLKSHPEIKQCNFSVFKTEIYDIPTLSEYLVQNSCTVKAIGIKRNIPKDAEESLARVIIKRPDFKVQYFG
jgi:hypothetical protein